MISVLEWGIQAAAALAGAALIALGGRISTEGSRTLERLQGLPLSGRYLRGVLGAGAYILGVGLLGAAVLYPFLARSLR